MKLASGGECSLMVFLANGDMRVIDKQPYPAGSPFMPDATQPVNV